MARPLICKLCQRFVRIMRNNTENIQKFVAAHPLYSPFWNCLNTF